MARITTAIGLLISLTLLAAAPSAAQFAGFGIKAGATFSHLHSDGVFYESSRSATGIVVGPFVEVALTRVVTFQPALVYARRGGTFRELPQSEVHELDLRRDYLEAQALFRYSGPWRDRLPVFLIGGPAIGWVLDYEVVEDGWDIGQPYTEDGAALPQPSAGYDLALVLGAGIARTQWGRQCTLDLVYRMASDGPRGNAAGNSFKADGVDLMLGLRF